MLARKQPNNQKKNRPAGLYLGDALLPLPQRLVDKISRLEFVVMSELLPEYWLAEEASEARCCHANTRRRCIPVTDILTRTQCFASLAIVLSRNHPEQTSDLLAYLSTIVRCHKKFNGLGGVQYDAVFRRQAAITRDLNWGRVNPTLYSICLAGQARHLIRYRICLSINHASEQCPQPPLFLLAPVAAGGQPPYPGLRHSSCN